MALTLKIKLFILLLIILIPVSESFGQKKEETTRILFVFDGSQSMYGRWGNESKLDIAARLLNQLVDSLKSYGDLQLALRAYGHQDPVVQGSRNCRDTKLEVPFGIDNHDLIKEKLNSIRPKGTTLIAAPSIEQMPVAANPRKPRFRVKPVDLESPF